MYDLDFLFIFYDLINRKFIDCSTIGGAGLVA